MGDNKNEKKEGNKNTILVAYDQQNPKRSQDDFLNDISKNNPDMIVYCNSNPWAKNNNEESIQTSDKTYIVAMPKDIADSWTKEEMKEAKLNFNIYDPRRNKEQKQKRQRRHGDTWAYYITTTPEVNYEKFSKTILSLFTKFEKKQLLLPDSYQIIFPKPLPNGQMRKYVIIEFNKFNDRFPVYFILKLQALIRNSTYDEVPLILKWAANNVISDIKSGKTKDKKEPKSNATKSEIISA